MVKVGFTPVESDVPSWWLRILSVATLVATFGLIVLGSAVRVTDSGMGCKGWPLCSGSLGPISRFHPLMEQSHRFLASLVTIMIVVLAIAAWRAGSGSRHLFRLALASVGVIVVQIVLGAVTVITNNAPITVALHLATAALFLGVVSVTAVASFVPSGRTWSLWSGPSRLARAMVAALFLVVISGSIVVNAGAQAACKSWPVCLTSPVATRLLIVQMAHRSVVLIGSVLVVVYLAKQLRSAMTERAERDLAVIGLVLLLVQIAVGALSALESTHTEFADAHLAVASALWGVVVAQVALSARGRLGKVLNGPPELTRSEDFGRVTR